ncbi:hypothetical protein LguiB_003820 [Lonicera macranthoides]
MRKLISAIDYNGTSSSFPPSSSISISISIPPSTSLSPTPSPSPLASNYDDFTEHPIFYFPTIPVVDSAFDLATLTLIAGLILLSLLSSSLIFHLRLKSRQSYHLQNFNSLWSVRLLLVSFVSLWAFNEILRLPFFRRRYLYPFIPSLTLNQQANLCKVHVVMSLGVWEPGLLVTLLFLVNISIKNGSKSHAWSIAFVFLMCLPVLLLQTFFVFLSPMEAQLPMIMHRSSIVTKDDYGNKSVMCTFPMFSCTVFAAFGIAYSLGFMLSCWKVMAFVINKGIRVRINVLAFTVMTALPLQILSLGMSTLFSPESSAYGFIMLVMFVCVGMCCTAGEFILVIKPTTEALAAGGECCRWTPGERSQREGYREGDVVDHFS